MHLKLPIMIFRLVNSYGHRLKIVTVHFTLFFSVICFLQFLDAFFQREIVTGAITCNFGMYMN